MPRSNSSPVERTLFDVCDDEFAFRAVRRIACNTSALSARHGLKVRTMRGCSGTQDDRFFDRRNRPRGHGICAGAARRLRGVSRSDDRRYHPCEPQVSSDASLIVAAHGFRNGRVIADFRETGANYVGITLNGGRSKPLNQL